MWWDLFKPRRLLREAESRAQTFLLSVGFNAPQAIEVLIPHPGHLTLATTVDGVTWLFEFGIAGDSLSFTGDADAAGAISADEIPDLIDPPSDEELLRRAWAYKRRERALEDLSAVVEIVRRHRSDLPTLLGGDRMADARSQILAQRKRYAEALSGLADS
jgi:hypothetical protein